ncbi:MAG: hypothetical protein LBJ12_02825 [Oscillospiraceae bacterium]|jgi:hypothetical protein|nr:hypothetical protein [Oscillospiraceae bacterium]
MEAVVHTAKESEKHWREFAEKRADFVLRELRELRADELKALLRTVKEDNHTFEQSA